MAEMIEQGTILRNAFNGEAFVFCYPQDGRARFESILDPGGTNGGGELVHIHPKSDEYFEVKSGQLRVTVDGKSVILGPGESKVVAKGTPHSFANAYDGTTEFITEFAPPQQYLRFFADFGLICERHREWFSADGKPSIWLMALKLNAYKDHLYLAGPPVFLQKILFGILAFIARMKGYRLEIAPSG
jgi:mannose-6-phosphate isomerase-like protein (cupin superfamily)